MARQIKEVDTKEEKIICKELIKVWGSNKGWQGDKFMAMAKYIAKNYRRVRWDD